jgi:hypothetical protein
MDKLGREEKNRDGFTLRWAEIKIQEEVLTELGGKGER